MKFAAISSAALAVSLLVAPAAHAAIIASNVAYTSAPAGPYDDVSTSSRVSGGAFRTGNLDGIYAQPPSTVGTYWATGPGNNGNGTIDVTGLSTLSFLWGSVDDFNSINFLGATNNVLASISGALVGPPANGDQGAPSTNRYVTLNLKDLSIAGVKTLQFNSTGNAFETANFLFGAVPEPATWGMMILGLGFAGAAMRRRQSVSVKYA